MAFQFEPRGRDGLNNVIHNRNALSRDEAIDLQTSERFYFFGCDPLDSTVPRTYVYINSSSVSWQIDVLSTREIPQDFLSALNVTQAEKPEYLAVIVHGAVSEAPSEARICEAFAALNQTSLPKIYFLSSWSALRQRQQMQSQKAYQVAIREESSRLRGTPSYAVGRAIARFFKLFQR